MPSRTRRKHAGPATLSTVRWGCPGLVDGQLLESLAVVGPVGARGNPEGISTASTGRCWARSSATLAPARGTSYGSCQAPALPLRGTTRGGPERRASDLDLQDRAGVSHHEVPNPFGETWPPGRHGMLAGQGLNHRAPFRVREAHENTMFPRMRDWRTSHLGHRTSRYHKVSSPA